MEMTMEPRLKNGTDAAPAVPTIEVYPACEHRFPVEHADGSVFCWVCGELLEEPK